MTASSAIFTDDNITGTKKFGANPARFTDEDNTDAVVIVGKQNAGVKASADGKSLLYEVGKKEASSVTLAKVDWAKGATVFDGVSAEERYAFFCHLGSYSVKHVVSCLYVVIAHCNRIVFHILQKSWEEVRGNSVYIVEIVGGVVSLEAVSGIDEYYIFSSHTVSEAVDHLTYGHQGLFLVSVRIGGVEPGSVYIVCGEDVESVVSILNLVAGQGRNHYQKQYRNPSHNSDAFVCQR